MREIKFRARWRDTGKLIKDFEDQCEISACNSSLLIVDQFTGIKDYNEKEIYEGDIVQRPHKKDLIGIIEYGRYLDSSSLGHCGFYIRWKIEDISGLDGSLEVIGNVYENPELLKK